MDHVTRPAVTCCPERTAWTFGSLGIVNAFLMRTPNEPVCGEHRPDAVRLQERGNLLADDGIVPNISSRGRPGPQRLNVRRFVRHDTDHDLGRELIVRAVVRDRSSREPRCSTRLPSLPLHPTTTVPAHLLVLHRAPSIRLTLALSRWREPARRAAPACRRVPVDCSALLGSRLGIALLAQCDDSGTIEHLVPHLPECRKTGAC